jgi:hypothetical protein
LSGVFERGAQVVQAVLGQASWLFASGHQIETALAISRTSGVNASITIGPS